MHSRANTYIKSTSVVIFILPPSIHFEISIPPDAGNFGTLRVTHQFLICYFLVDYRYTNLDIYCK